jgi:hypothetical protein
MDFNSLANNATKMASFKASVISSIALAANVAESMCSIKTLVAGLVVVDTAIAFPADTYTAAEVGHLYEPLHPLTVSTMTNLVAWRPRSVGSEAPGLTCVSQFDLGSPAPRDVSMGGRGIQGDSLA